LGGARKESPGGIEKKLKDQEGPSFHEGVCCGKGKKTEGNRNTTTLEKGRKRKRGTVKKLTT